MALRPIHYPLRRKSRLWLCDMDDIFQQLARYVKKSDASELQKATILAMLIAIEDQLKEKNDDHKS
mgnify:CR=1 FL=1